MLEAFIKKGCFQDSVSLMILSRKLCENDQVDQVSVMMGTPANKDLFHETGLWHNTFSDATPNDICVAIKGDEVTPEAVEMIQEAIEAFLTQQAKGGRRRSFPKARSWRRATDLLPDANLALISVAGEYADQSARQAIETGMNVMIFSDNISVETERELKETADARGQLVMGPDCGTSIINGAPMAFANEVEAGSIGIIGASGTGIQELTSQITLLGNGITHAIGLGGRDLSLQIGGISALRALKLMAADDKSRVIAFVSKPPAPEVRRKVLQEMKSLGKPVVALFLGEQPERTRDGNVFLTSTLDETARIAVELAQTESLLQDGPTHNGQKISGLYTGGTLAAESSMLLANALGANLSHSHPEGVMFEHDGHRIIDLGDDAYTVGKPHPMIDPSVRNEHILALADKPEVGVLLVDVVLGFGSHENPAGEVTKAIKKLRELRSKPITVIATMTGTDLDPQDRTAQSEILTNENIMLASSTREAVTLAYLLVNDLTTAATSESRLINDSPQVINIGLASFAEDLQKHGTSVVHYQWSPVAGGNRRMSELLNKLK